MKKQLLLINLVLALMTTSFASTPLFPKFIIDKLKQPKAEVQKTINSHEGYANFSGNWVGTCDNDPDKTQTMIIEQSSDSSSMVIDNIKYPIDAILTNGFHGNFETENSIVHYHWSKDGQQLLSTGFYYYKAGNLSQEGLQALISKSSWSIENGQLVTTNTFSFFTNGILTNIYTFGCVYKKSS